MTDLTEQWKKGELINGKKYYITFFDSEPFEATFRYYEAMIPYWKFEANGKQYCDENGYDCVKVLAQVPSYDDWMATSGTAQFLMDKNAQFKELLMEWVQFEIEENPNDFTVISERMSELANKTKQAIGEKK